MFLATETQGLKKQGDPDAREVWRLQAKLGEVMMRLELVEDRGAPCAQPDEGFADEDRKLAKLIRLECEGDAIHARRWTRSVRPH